MVQTAGEADELIGEFMSCEVPEAHSGIEIQLTVVPACGSGIQDRG